MELINQKITMKDLKNLHRFYINFFAYEPIPKKYIL